MKRKLHIIFDRENGVAHPDGKAMLFAEQLAKLCKEASDEPLVVRVGTEAMTEHIRILILKKKLNYKKVFFFDPAHTNVPVKVNEFSIIQWSTEYMKKENFRYNHLSILLDLQMKARKAKLLKEQKKKTKAEIDKEENS